MSSLYYSQYCICSVRANQPDKIHFLLDAGALGIVCPLINTETEVRSSSKPYRLPITGGIHLI